MIVDQSQRIAGAFMDTDSDTLPRFSARMSASLDAIEKTYLRILRTIILVIATLMIGYAAWLALSGLYRTMQSTASVVEATATVNASDIISADTSPQSVGLPIEQRDPIDPHIRKFYTAFVSRYYTLFRQKFEPYRQSDDKRLSKEEFDDAFLQTGARLDAIKNGDLDFSKDKNDLELLFKVMSEGANLPQTTSRLAKYKSAKRVGVIRKVQKTRSETRRGWDSYSTACASWYVEPIGCATSRLVDVPYTETVRSMQFPQGTESHSQLFRSFQDRFFKLLSERRDNAAKEAQSERDDIIAGQYSGKASLLLALQIAGGFLMLMFFFLLIAIERHQRHLSLLVTPAIVENE